MIHWFRCPEHFLLPGYVPVNLYDSSTWEDTAFNGGCLSNRQISLANFIAVNIDGEKAYILKDRLTGKRGIFPIFDAVSLFDRYNEQVIADILGEKNQFTSRLEVLL